MKKLEEFKDEINKCSKCGLCQSVCPVYKLTGNDCAVSRGKFIMLDGVLKGDLTLNKNIDKYLNLCLKCNKCKEFCPSAIDVCEIFAAAKSEYFKKTFSAKFISFLQSNFIFSNAIKFAQIIANPFRKKTKKQQGTKLLYFKGCVNNVFPKVENALKKVLSKFDVELIEKDFDCCGVPFLSSGNSERYIQAAEKNIALINSEDYDFLLTDCASCASAISSYKKHFENVANLKLINIAEFLTNQDKQFIFKKPLRVTFHKPCHLENIDFLKPLLEKCKNVEYIEMQGFDDCCGLAGEFVLHNPQISLAIAKKKALHITETNADYVLTLCPACVMGIQEGFGANYNLGKKAPQVLNLVEFLALADEII